MPGIAAMPRVDGTVRPPADDAERQRLVYLIVGLVAVLVCVGIQMVHSSSLTSRPSIREELYLTRHLAFLGFSVVVSAIVSRVTPEQLERNAPFIFWAFITLLVMVLIPGVGSRINGARRWLRISGLSLQPSELGRIALPLMAAAGLHRHAPDGCQRFFPVEIGRICWPLLIALPLVIVEPDLGATVFLSLGFAMTLFVGGWSLRTFALGGLLAAPLVLSLLILRPYQVQRISGFLDAWSDFNLAPWQVRQSLMSLGTGGLQGAGIGNGWQKLSYLPEANTDFVFAVIGEELGLAGTLAICIVWLGILLVGSSFTNTLPAGTFRRTIATALLLQLVVQAAINVAVVTALVPPKGVPHPFISYGGTNLFVSLVSVGLIVGQSRSGSDITATRDHER